MIARAAGPGDGPGLIAFIRGVGQTDFNYARRAGRRHLRRRRLLPDADRLDLDLMDLERVEVLRGPQGTLAGKNSIGGAIKLFSRKPDGDGGGSVSLTYGDYNRVDVRAVGDFTLIDDKLFVRVAGVSKNRDGYVDRIDYACAHPGTALPDRSMSVRAASSARWAGFPTRAAACPSAGCPATRSKSTSSAT